MKLLSTRGHRIAKAWFVAIVLTLLSQPLHALDASDFDDALGYTVVAVTHVEDEFEGCDFEKRIHFDNGWTLTCSSYSYSYAYRPTAVIFAKVIVYRGTKYWTIKALIDDEIYDMELIRAR